MGAQLLIKVWDDLKIGRCSSKGSRNFCEQKGRSYTRLILINCIVAPSNYICFFECKKMIQQVYQEEKRMKNQGLYSRVIENIKIKIILPV